MNFGYAIASCAVRGFLLVGAPSLDSSSSEGGAVAVYSLTSGNDGLVFEAAMSAPEPADDDYFGSAVAVGDDVAYIGAGGTGRSSSHFLYCCIGALT
jgi:hypothetical protein